MKIIPVACPKCGASFEIEEGRSKCFCQYCGTQIVIDDGSRSITNTQIIRDEAKIKELELRAKQLELEVEQSRAKEEERKRQLEIEAENERARQQSKSASSGVNFILLAFAIIMFLVSFAGGGIITLFLSGILFIVFILRTIINALTK